MARLSTVAAFGFSDFDPPVTLGLFRRLGCTSSQFYRNEAKPPSIEEAVKIAADVGLPFDSIHGVFGPTYDPSCPDESTRAASIEIYEREGELACALGGPMVVVHPAPIGPTGHQITPGERAERVTPLRRSIDELTALGEKLGVVYLIENLPNTYWLGNDPIELASWVRAVDSPHVRMCYDTGHALMTGTVDDRLAACADVVGYMHIHDNDAHSDDHLMPGDGVTDWQAIRKVLREHRLDVPAMLEVFYLADRLTACAESDLPSKLAHWLDVPTASGSGGPGSNLVGERRS